jgi:hypothetical protein
MATAKPTMVMTNGATITAAYPAFRDAAGGHMTQRMFINTGGHPRWPFLQDLFGQLQLDL